MTVRCAARSTGSTCATRCGRRGASPTARSRCGCWRRWRTRGTAAAGEEALLVSHQLPIWTARSYVEGRRLWHDPRKRQCTLASLTTFTYEDGRIVSVDYPEPAADLLPGGPAGGKKFVAGA